MQGNLRFFWLAIAVVVIEIPAQVKSVFLNLVPSLELMSLDTEHPWLCGWPVACFDLGNKFKDDAQCWVIFFSQKLREKETITLQVSAWPHILFVIQEETKVRENRKNEGVGYTGLILNHGLAVQNRCHLLHFLVAFHFKSCVGWAVQFSARAFFKLRNLNLRINIFKFGNTWMP